MKNSNKRFNKGIISPQLLVVIALIAILIFVSVFLFFKPAIPVEGYATTVPTTISGVATTAPVTIPATTGTGSGAAVTVGCSDMGGNPVPCGGSSSLQIYGGSEGPYFVYLNVSATISAAANARALGLAFVTDSNSGVNKNGDMLAAFAKAKVIGPTIPYTSATGPAIASAAPGTTYIWDPRWEDQAGTQCSVQPAGGGQSSSCDTTAHEWCVGTTTKTCQLPLFTCFDISSYPGGTIDDPACFAQVTQPTCTNFGGGAKCKWRGTGEMAEVTQGYDLDCKTGVGPCTWKSTIVGNYTYASQLKSFNMAAQKDAVVDIDPLFDFTVQVLQG